MRLSDFLKLMESVARKNNISEPYITGGVPRDKLLNRLNQIEDLDITTGDETVHILASKTMENLPNYLDASFKILDDGHAQIIVGPVKLDFSSNYYAPGIENLLKRAGIKNPTNMQKELYSRDFTCNTLLMNFNMKKIKDPIGLGVKDIKNRYLRTCLPARFTFRNDPKRVVRTFYFAAKLGFNVDEEIVVWIRENTDVLKKVKPKFLTDKLKQAAKYDLNKTTNLLNQTYLWDNIPLIPELWMSGDKK